MSALFYLFIMACIWYGGNQCFPHIPHSFVGVFLWGFSGCGALGVAGTGGPREYPNGGSESLSPAAGLEVRNLFPLKGSALFFASFFKEKKFDK